MHSPRPPNHSPPPPDARGRIPRALISNLREHGVDLEAIAAAEGITSDALDGLLPLATVDAILERGFIACADPAIGLRIGAEIRPELFGVIGFAAMSSPNLGVAFTRIARYKQALAGDRLTLLHAAEGVAVRCELSAASDAYAAIKVDAEFAFLIAFARRMTSAPISPLRVVFTAPAPADPRPHARLFGCPLEFSAPCDELWLAADDLARPLISADAGLTALFVPEAERLLRLSASERLSERVRGALGELLRGELPGVGAVARRLGLSERSLQRRLHAEGTSFAALVDTTRHELATHFIAVADLPVAEVAFLLGFAGAPSFHRAFRRWTNTTPEAYRAESRREHLPALG